MLSINSEDHAKRSLTQRRKITRKDINFDGEILVAGNKVGFLTFKGKLISVLIESEVLAETMKCLFKLAWDNDKK